MNRSSCLFLIGVQNETDTLKAVFPISFSTKANVSSPLNQEVLTPSCHPREQNPFSHKIPHSSSRVDSPIAIKTWTASSSISWQDSVSVILLLDFIWGSYSIDYHFFVDDLIKYHYTSFLYLDNLFFYKHTRIYFSFPCYFSSVFFPLSSTLSFLWATQHWFFLLFFCSRSPDFQNHR